MALISSTVFVRIGGLMELVVSLNAAKLIRNLACQVSNCKIVGNCCWLFFTVVVSLGVESIVRTDWLLAMAETVTDEVADMAIFDSRR